MQPEQNEPGLGAPVPVMMPLWWAEVGADGHLCVGRVGDMWSPTPGSLWWGNYHAETADEVRDQAIRSMGKDVADHRAVIELTWTRMGEATARWRAEDPAARERVLPDLGDLLTWLMVDADRARAALAGIRAAGARPGLLRWCSWPGCFASFNAATGPEDDGWKRYAGALSVLLCPAHAAAGHWPGFDTGDVTYLVARCGCGEASQVRPAQWTAVITWWEQHLTSLGLIGSGS